MTRQQWGWIAAIGLSLLFLLATGKYAFDRNAIGGSTDELVGAGAWALTVLIALANLLGLFGAIRDSSKSLAFRILNSLAGRLTIIALSLALGAVFLAAGLAVEPPRTWTCSVQNRLVGAPETARCPGTGFAQMRSFSLRVRRAGALDDQPVIGARVVDRTVSAVAIDSDRGGLCVASGPDYPTRGESRLVLSADCGTDQLYIVNLHLCDTRVIESASDRSTELRAAVRLEIREGNHASAVVCE
jgi:hypothetical protein